MERREKGVGQRRGRYGNEREGCGTEEEVSIWEERRENVGGRIGKRHVVGGGGAGTV